MVRQERYKETVKKEREIKGISYLHLGTLTGQGRNRKV
jgi:hypothetical protein